MARRSRRRSHKQMRRTRKGGATLSGLSQLSSEQIKQIRNKGGKFGLDGKNVKYSPKTGFSFSGEFTENRKNRNTMDQMAKSTSTSAKAIDSAKNALSSTRKAFGSVRNSLYKARHSNGPIKRKLENIARKPVTSGLQGLKKVGWRAGEGTGKALFSSGKALVNSGKAFGSEFTPLPIASDMAKTSFAVKASAEYAYSVKDLVGKYNFYKNNEKVTIFEETKISPTEKLLNVVDVVDQIILQDRVTKEKASECDKIAKSIYEIERKNDRDVIKEALRAGFTSRRLTVPLLTKVKEEITATLEKLVAQVKSKLTTVAYESRSHLLELERKSNEKLEKLDALEKWETAVYKDFNIETYRRKFVTNHDNYDTSYTEKEKEKINKLIREARTLGENFSVDELVILLKYHGLLDSIKDVVAMIKTVNEALRNYSNSKIDTPQTSTAE